MPLTPQQAYDQIKALENQGQIPAPTPVETIHVGTFNAETGKFEFAVPTAEVKWAENRGTLPNGKPVPPIEHTTTVGRVSTWTADLQLTFSVAHSKGNFTVTVGTKTVTLSTLPPVHTLVEPNPADVKGSDPIIVKGPPRGLLPPTSLTVDLGLWASHTTPAPNQPPGTRVSLWSGSASTTIQLEIDNFPVLVGAGAFTIPVLPVAVIYAPPPGVLNMNYVAYSTSTSVTTRISTSFSSSNSQKRADAYTASDYITKLGDVAEQIAKLDKASDKTQAGIALGLDLITGILGQTTFSDTEITTDQGTRDIVTADIATYTTGSTPGLPPGLGDRFVYLRNIQVAWVIAFGQMSFTVLGYEGVRAVDAKDLLADLDAISASSGGITVGPATDLDAPTIHRLLAPDPYINNPTPYLPSPRFTPNDPATVGGVGTPPPGSSSPGDSYSVTHQVSQSDTATTTAASATITDYKPGWLVSLFDGAESTEDQVTFTFSVTTQGTTDHTQTVTVYFFAPAGDPPYIVGLYFDLMFGTFAFTPATF